MSPVVVHRYSVVMLLVEVIVWAWDESNVVESYLCVCNLVSLNSTEEN